MLCSLFLKSGNFYNGLKIDGTLIDSWETTLLIYFLVLNYKWSYADESNEHRMASYRSHVFRNDWSSFWSNSCDSTYASSHFHHKGRVDLITWRPLYVCYLLRGLTFFYSCRKHTETYTIHSIKKRWQSEGFIAYC